MVFGVCGGVLPAASQTSVSRVTMTSRTRGAWPCCRPPCSLPTVDGPGVKMESEQATVRGEGGEADEEKQTKMRRKRIEHRQQIISDNELNSSASLPETNLSSTCSPNGCNTVYGPGRRSGVWQFAKDQKGWFVRWSRRKGRGWWPRTCSAPSPTPNRAPDLTSASMHHRRRRRRYHHRH